MATDRRTHEGGRVAMRASQTRRDGLECHCRRKPDAHQHETGLAESAKVGQP